MSTRNVLVVAAAGVALLVVAAAVLAGLFVVAPVVLADRYSHYDYQFEVETTDTLTDVTFYLPVPADSEGPMVGEIVVRDDNGSAVANVSSVVETEHGPMLSVEVDRLEGSLSYLLLTFDEEGDLVDREVIAEDEVPDDMSNKQLSPIPTRYTVYVFYEFRDGGRPIETRTPMDDDATLAPKYNTTERYCETPYTDEDDTCYGYETMLYVGYDTGEETSVVVSGEYAGWNEWGWGLSNSYNVFTERIERTGLDGPQSGWIVVEGTLHAGEGRYPTRGN
jgi:hypothetical protein